VLSHSSRGLAVGSGKEVRNGVKSGWSGTEARTRLSRGRRSIAVKVLKRTDRQLKIQIGKDERAALIVRNKTTAEEKELRVWFMPAILNFETEKVWYELEERSDSEIYTEQKQKC
jgi:hypothetical protein